MNPDGDDGNILLNMLREQMNQRRDSDSVVPVVEYAEYKKFLSDNAGKLILVIVGHAGDPLIEIVRQVPADVVKESPTTTAACIVHVNKSREAAEKFAITNRFEFVFVRNGSEVKRFTCEEIDQMRSYFVDNRPKHCFTGQGRSIGGAARGAGVDTEAYFRSKRVRAPDPAQIAAPKRSVSPTVCNTEGFTEKQKEVLIRLIEYDFLETDEIVQAIRETNSENEDEIVYYVERLQGQGQKVEEVKCDAEVKGDAEAEYDAGLYEELSFMGYSDDEIKASFRAGCRTFDQCEEFISTKKENKIEEKVEEKVEEKRVRVTDKQIQMYMSFLRFPNINKSDLKRAIIECGENAGADEILKYVNKIKSGALPPTTGEYDDVPFELPKKSENVVKQPQEVTPKVEVSSVKSNRPMSAETMKILERKEIISRIHNERNGERAAKAVKKVDTVRKVDNSTDVILRIMIQKKSPLQITMNVDSTFEDLRSMLVEKGLIGDEDDIRIRHPLKGFLSDFSQTFKEKMLTGKQALYIDVL